MLGSAQILQAFFIFSVSTIVFLNFFPAVREHFITYGPRTAAARDAKPPPDDETKKPRRTSLEILFESIASYQVPHAYFKHFYIVSVASTLFWAFQYVSNGKLLHRIIGAAAISPSRTGPSMSMEQIELTWALMGIQGLRRQLETSMLTKASVSTMWFGHYVLGIAFYLAMGVAVWIEGADTLLSTTTTTTTPQGSFTLSPPSLRTLLLVLLFTLASTIQSFAHIHLASLPKYTLPSTTTKSPLFNHLICPHYTAECIIYLSLALLAAPQHSHPGLGTGTWTGVNINTTLFTACLFVVGNLSVTAAGTKRWYELKFGEGSVREKWIMLPFVW